MSPARLFSRFTRDPLRLTRYYGLETLVLVVSTWGLSWRYSAQLELRGFHLLALFFALPFGWWVSAVLHAAAHGSYRGRWLNRVLGELSGAYVGYGFGSFVLIHGLHHTHSDERHDPVCPRQMTFIRFLSGPMRHAIVKARAYLDETHGAHPHYALIRLVEGLLFHVNLALRVSLWFLLFGPELFVAFYVPSILSNVAILAHINFACHRDREDGTVQIVNLDHNLYYRLANAVTSGGYYHEAHHLHPGLRDPRSAARDAEVSTTRPSHDHRGGLIARAKRYFDVSGIWGER